MVDILFKVLFAVDWKNILDQFLSYVFFFMNSVNLRYTLRYFCIYSRSLTFWLFAAMKFNEYHLFCNVFVKIVRLWKYEIITNWKKIRLFLFRPPPLGGKSPLKLPLSVCHQFSKQFLSKTAGRIFPMIFRLVLYLRP